MSDLDNECMNKYHSHLASIHSAKQEEAARLQIPGLFTFQSTKSWIGLNSKDSINDDTIDFSKWRFSDYTQFNGADTHFEDYIKSIVTPVDDTSNVCTLLKIKDDNSEEWQKVACDNQALTETGICGTYGFFSNEYRTFIFNIEQDINEISMINIFIENENNKDISVCIDEVELVSATQFNAAGTLGSIIKTEIKNDQQSYVFMKYPVCNIEIIDGTTLRIVEKTEESKTETTETRSECKNYNRFATSACVVQQDYTKEDSLTVSVSHSRESSYSVAQTNTRSFGWSLSIAALFGYQIGGANNFFKNEYTGTFEFRNDYSFSTERTRTKSFSTSYSDGIATTVSKTVSCSASIDVPRGHKQSYSLSFTNTNTTIPTTSDLKLTLCSYYIDNGNNAANADEPDEDTTTSHFKYYRGVPGKIEISETSQCTVEFGPPIYVNNKMPCNEEQQLGWLSQQSSYSWIPRCNLNDITKYDGCQCLYDATDLDRSSCICVDPETGDPIKDGYYEFNVESDQTDDADRWFLSCQKLNCPGSAYGTDAENPYKTQVESQPQPIEFVSNHQPEIQPIESYDYKFMVISVFICIFLILFAIKNQFVAQKSYGTRLPMEDEEV